MAKAARLKFRVYDKTLSIPDAYKRYIAHKRGCGMSDSTIVQADKFYKAFCECLLESMKTHKIEPAELVLSGNLIDGFEVAQMEDTDFITVFREYLEARGLAESSINIYLKNYITFYNYLANEEKLIKPQQFSLRPPQEKMLPLYTDEQLAALLAPPKDKRNFYEYEIWVIVNYILNTGNRRSSVINITMDDWAQVERFGFLPLSHTKNRKIQNVVVPYAIKRIINEWVKMWRYDALPQEPLFPMITGKKYEKPTLLTNYYERYVKNRCGDDCPTSLHRLRHQYAAEYLRSGGNIWDLKEQLGHQSFAMVQRYANHYATPNVDEVEKHAPVNVRRYMMVDKLKPKKK